MLCLLNALLSYICEMTLEKYSESNFCHTVGTIIFPMGDIHWMHYLKADSISLEPAHILSKIMLFKKLNWTACEGLCYAECSPPPTKK